MFFVLSASRMIAWLSINSQCVVAALENVLTFVSGDSRVATLFFIHFSNIEAIALNFWLIMLLKTINRKFLSEIKYYVSLRMILFRGYKTYCRPRHLADERSSITTRCVVPRPVVEDIDTVFFLTSLKYSQNSSRQNLSSSHKFYFIIRRLPILRLALLEPSWNN